MRHMTWIIAATVGLGAVCLSGSGCSKQEDTGNGSNAQQPAESDQGPPTLMPPEQAAREVTRAVCVLHPVGDSGVTGTVTFSETDEGLEVVAEVRGLSPGDHGFHVHEWGDCTAPDGTSAGGHYNPMNHEHGRPDAPADRRHVGDFGNITADENGAASHRHVDQVASLNGPYSIVGRAVILHALPDDFGQPTGNAGGRIACGVIGIGKPEAGN